MQYNKIIQKYNNIIQNYDLIWLSDFHITIASVSLSEECVEDPQ